MIAGPFLLGCAIVGEKWGIEQFGRLGELLEGIASSATFVAVLVAGWVGLKRYTRQLRLRAADIMLRMEPEHRKILATCIELELDCSYETWKPILTLANEQRTIEGDGRLKVAELDRCLRFFYACTVLDHLGVEEIAIVRAYYFYFLMVADPRKGELRTYIAQYYPRLSEWLETNRLFLEYFRDAGEWKPSYLTWRRINKRRLKEGKPALVRPK